jgi:hypothetical protein
VARAPPPELQTWAEGPPPALLPAAVGTDTYVDSVGDTFLVNTRGASLQAAQQFCVDKGGHLATYDSMDQQSEVELALITKVGQPPPLDPPLHLPAAYCRLLIGSRLGSPCLALAAATPHPPRHLFPCQGSLIPEFHMQYWYGLRATSLNPTANWKYTDPFSPDYFLRTSYKHWGTYLEAGMAPQEEPNNRFPSELCVAANYTEAFGNAWGWSDTQCGQQMPYMCRMRSECRGLARGADTCSRALCAKPPVPGADGNATSARSSL